MARYIDAEVFDAFGYTRPTGKYDFDDGVEFVLDKIDKQPTADVRENVHGEWEIYKYDENAYDIYGNESFAIWYRCSNCGFIHAFIDNHTGQYNFCPNCGARMNERREDAT